jgi:RecB family exonuclease
MASRRTLAELIERAIGQSGYRELLLSLEWGERRLANVHKLIRLARRFEETDGRDLRGFLDHVAYRQVSRAGAEPDAPASGRPLDAVQLMTVHAAKGLEFPVVCVADLGRGRNLSTPELLVDGDRIGLRLVYLDGREAVTTLDFDELSAESRKRGAEEEERIIYVAMTRARERLLLSGAVAFEKWPQGDRAPAIAWLGPALSPELKDILAASGDGVIDLPVGRDARATVRLCVNTHEAVRARAGDSELVAPRARVPPVSPDAAARLPADAGGERPGPSGQLQLDLRGEPSVGPLSYTALTELERCGYRYYLERVLQLGEDRARAQAGGGGGRGGDELAARTRGILIHRLLEDVDFRGRHELGPGDVERAAAELGVRVAAGEREEVTAMVHAVSHAAATGFEPALRVAAALSVHRESPFALSLGTDRPLLTGVIDLLAREAGGSVLVLDYKSDHLEDGQELEALTEREYGLQRALYALALLRDGAPAVDIVHWYLRRPHESVTARYLAGDLAGLEERVGERIDSALSDPFAVSRNPHRGLCLTCPGRARLCSWTDAETLREPSAA